MPKWRRIVFLLMLLAFFIMPLYIAPIAGNIIGSAWIYGIFVGGTYIFTPSQFIHPLLFAVGLLSYQTYLFRTSSGKIRNRTRFAVLFYFLWVSVILAAVGIMMNLMLILLSPATYFYLIIPIISALKIEIENRKSS